MLPFLLENYTFAPVLSIVLNKVIFFRIFNSFYSFIKLIYAETIDSHALVDDHVFWSGACNGTV